MADCERDALHARWDSQGRRIRGLLFHPKGNDATPLSGEGVLIELIQAPQEVIEAFAKVALSVLSKRFPVGCTSAQIKADDGRLFCNDYQQAATAVLAAVSPLLQ